MPKSKYRGRGSQRIRDDIGSGLSEAEKDRFGLGKGLKKRPRRKIRTSMVNYGRGRRRKIKKGTAKGGKAYYTFGK